MLTSYLIYTKDTAAMAAFYHQNFGFTALQEQGDRIVELKDGQTLVKLIFGVRDVAGFCTRARQNNLVFGPVHKANGYEFANAKDPDGHPIQVSSRIYRKGAQRNRPSP